MKNNDTKGRSAVDLVKMGKFIADARKKQGLTQSQLGEKLGLSGKAISKWERGISAPDISILNDLSKILKVSVSEILTGEKINEEINNEATNKITLSGIDAYNQLFKKRYSKVILILILILFFICLLFSTTYLITNYNKCFVYKLSSGSNDFGLEGLIASNQKENSLILTRMNYIDPSQGTLDEIRVNLIEIELRINGIVVLNYKKQYDNINYSEAIGSITITSDESSKITQIINSNKMKNIKLIIYYIDVNGKKVKQTFPIEIEKKFSNNKLFY